MFMLLRTVLVLALAGASAVEASDINCRMITFPVSVSAQNEVFGNDFDPDNTTSIAAFL
jgi:ABC-type enterochelin transport system permease subunit